MQKRFKHREKYVWIKKMRRTWNNIVRLWSSFPLAAESRRGPRTLPVEAARFLIMSGTSIRELGFFFGTSVPLSWFELLAGFEGGRHSTEPPRVVTTPSGLEGESTVELDTLSVLPNSLVLESCKIKNKKNNKFVFNRCKRPWMKTHAYFVIFHSR